MYPYLIEITGVKHLSRSVTVLLGLLSMLASTSAWAAPAMVWTQGDAPYINVYYSPDGTHTQQITSAGVNISPNLFRTENSTWLTWVDKTNQKANQLKYARLSATGTVVETGTLPTVNGDLYAPAVSVDAAERRVWLVWVEFNGRREILYASYRDIENNYSSRWKPALQITPDDQYSANLPSIERALFDRARLSWMRTGPSSSESASVEIMAHDWVQATTSGVDTATVRQAPRRQLTLKNVEGYGAFIKRSKMGKFPYNGLLISPEEQSWTTLVRQRKALMGAAHSGPGASTRLVDVEK